MKSQQALPPARDSAIRGGAALAFSQGARQIMRLLVTVILARLLLAEAFGVIALIMGILALGQTLQQAGLSAATVQRAQVSNSAISTMFWINTTLATLMTLAFMVGSSSLAAWFGKPELAGLVKAASLTFILNGVVAQHRALLQRQMRFVVAAKIEMFSALVGGLSAIAMALAGWNHWALLGQILITDLIALVLLASVVRWPLTAPSFTNEVLEMVKFGASLLGFNLVLAASRNLHVVLLGKSIGLTEAGLYTRGFALASIPGGLLQNSSAHVALPKLSRHHGDTLSFARFYYRSVRLMSLITLPIALAFALLSEEITLLVYGANWTEVAELLSIFSLGLAFSPLLHGTGPIFISRGEPHRMFRWGVFGSAVIGAGTIVGLRWGMPGVAWGWSGTTVLLLLPCLAYAYRGTNLTILETMKQVRGAYVAAVCAFPVGWLLHQASQGHGPLTVAIICFAGTSLVYFTLSYCVLGQRDLIDFIVDRATAHRRRKPSA